MVERISNKERSRITIADYISLLGLLTFFIVVAYLLFLWVSGFAGFIVSVALSLSIGLLLLGAIIKTWNSKLA
jgi:hypothetical protein